MLQYLTQNTDKYSVAEQCQMVIEGGCSWIQLHMPQADDSVIRELSSELIPLCKETSTILMLENKPHLAQELGLHGVHLTLDSGLDARKIREEFGPEAIIGVEVGIAASILALKGADIDYVTLPYGMSLKQCQEIIDTAAKGGNEMPVVICSDYGVEDLQSVMATGAQGICTGNRIICAADPVTYCERMIDTLHGLSKR